MSDLLLQRAAPSLPYSKPEMVTSSREASGEGKTRMPTTKALLEVSGCLWGGVFDIREKLTALLVLPEAQVHIGNTAVHLLPGLIALTSASN